MNRSRNPKVKTATTMNTKKKIKPKKKKRGPTNPQTPKHKRRWPLSRTLTPHQPSLPSPLKPTTLKASPKTQQQKKKTLALFIIILFLVSFL